MADQGREFGQMLGSIREPRTRAMYEYYAAGATLEEVGRRFNVTRERVAQLFRGARLPTRSTKETAALQREKQVTEVGAKICEEFARSKDTGAVARRLGVSRGVVEAVVAGAFTPAERRRPPGHKKKYSDEELIGFLQQASAALGGVLTTHDYSEYARGRTLPDGRSWPTHQTHLLRFKTWRAALAAAGLRANRTSGIAGKFLFEEGHCIDAVRAAARQLGKVPTAAEYEEFARGSGGALPSQATVRNRCGTWYEALGKAGL